VIGYPVFLTTNSLRMLACDASIRAFVSHSWMVNHCKLKPTNQQLSYKLGSGDQRNGAQEAQHFPAGIDDLVQLIGQNQHGIARAKCMFL